MWPAAIGLAYAGLGVWSSVAVNFAFMILHINPIVNFFIRIFTGRTLKLPNAPPKTQFILIGLMNMTALALLLYFSPFTIHSAWKYVIPFGLTTLNDHGANQPYYLIHEMQDRPIAEEPQIVTSNLSQAQTIDEAKKFLEDFKANDAGDLQSFEKQQQYFLLVVKYFENRQVWRHEPSLCAELLLIAREKCIYTFLPETNLILEKYKKDRTITSKEAEDVIERSITISIPYGAWRRVVNILSNLVEYQLEYCYITLM